MKTLEEHCQEMCESIDKLQDNEVTPGTPLYDLQMGLIAAAKRYREKKNNLNKREMKDG